MVYKCFGVRQTKTEEPETSVYLVGLVQECLESVNLSFTAKWSCPIKQVLKNLGKDYDRLFIEYFENKEYLSVEIESIMAICSDRGILVFLVGERSNQTEYPENPKHKCFTYLNFIFQVFEANPTKRYLAYTDDCHEIPEPISCVAPPFFF